MDPVNISRSRDRTKLQCLPRLNESDQDYSVCCCCCYCEVRWHRTGVTHCSWRSAVSLRDMAFSQRMYRRDGVSSLCELFPSLRTILQASPGLLDLKLKAPRTAERRELLTQRHSIIPQKCRVLNIRRIGTDIPLGRRE